MAGSVVHSEVAAPELPSDAEKHLLAAVVGRKRLLLNQEHLVAGLLLLIAVAFNLVALYPEVAIKAPMLNDGVLHVLALERVAAALDKGQIAIDLWLPGVALGYPLFHYYQHLPYVAQAAVFHLLQERVALPDLFRWTHYLLLSFFPISIYWSMRRFGFQRLTAAMSGFVASLLATNGLYGFDFSSYTWSGYGLYTQLWGMFFLPPALASATIYLRSGRGLLLATLLLAITALSNLVLGYVAFVSLAALFFLPLLGPATQEKRSRLLWRRAKRLLLLLALVALATAYFWIPFILDSPYINRSVWEEAGKVEANGMRWTLSTVVRGELFDYGRFPALTLLATIGLVICLWRWREERYRIPVILSLLWLLLYFGWPTWDGLLDFLPLSSSLHLHRFIAGVHLGGIFLMGIGLALPWQWAFSKGKLGSLATVAIFIVLLLIPVYKERRAYLVNNERLMAQSKAALELEKADLDALMATLRSLPPGRVYAGNGANWGKAYTVGAVPLYAILNSARLDMVGYLYHALSLNANIQVLFDESRLEHYELFNVRYVVAPAGQEFPEFVHLVAPFGRHRLYQVRTSGYFELIKSGNSIPINNENFYTAVSRWLNSDGPGQKEHPILVWQGPIAEIGRTLSTSEECETDLLAQAPTHAFYSHLISETVEEDAYSAVVYVERPSCLILKTSYHPNWRATVDGVETQTAMLMPSYVGLKVVPGTHLVRIEYHPRRQKGYLSLAAILILSLMLLLQLRHGVIKRVKQIRSQVFPRP
jgi:hypothetical protein